MQYLTDLISKPNFVVSPASLAPLKTFQFCKSFVDSNVTVELSLPIFFN